MFMLDPFSIGIASFVVILTLIQLGFHVAIALATTSFLSVWLLRDTPVIAFHLLFMSATDSISSYDFAVIPLFVLMGMLVVEAGVAKDAYAAADRVFRKLRGGLGVATVAANAVFAAVTGVSIASAAVFTRIALPQLLSLGYAPRLSLGIIAGSSILGMLIPPSLLMIVFGILTEVSIGSLFIAGIVPGFIMAVLFSLLIVLTGLIWPASVGVGHSPAPEATETTTKRSTMGGVWPIALMVTIIMGGIYGGFFTPTEAGAVGATLGLGIALVRKSLTRSSFLSVLLETGKITAAICILVVGATMYSRMLAMTGLPSAIPIWMQTAGLGFGAALAIYIAMIVVMGLFLDSISVLLLVVPITFPFFIAAGVDPVWFGIVTIIAVEIGILTPPVGIALFVVLASAEDPDITLKDVALGALPFVGAMAFCLGLIIAFPMLITITSN
ncbi:TRAP transporter large permease [Puniceibacterium sp. IMCC21224]|uniref:TRAP transporter large permease n=1 Tax=Puniceibacterium sp. IMCC21224 TaxID=1618204 RepID=UPI00065DB5E5|nr:TRAP transporter large permease [Puniceibacterium sp. IMCC21224]KMK64552.1 TRAP transporter, DctM subunit [Puniceibacterium sp. IMCC21224]